MTEITETVRTFENESVFLISLLVMVVLSLVVTGCLFWELCVRKLYRKPALRCNARALTSPTDVKSSLRKKNKCRKELSVRFSDELESICLSDIYEDRSITESAIFLSDSYEGRSVTESAGYNEDQDLSEVFMVHAQAAFSPYHLTYTTPRKSTDHVDIPNLFNCEMSPVDNEPEIHESRHFDNIDEHKDSGHCVDDDDADDDDDNNRTENCDVKIDLFLNTSSKSSTCDNASDCDKGIGSLETSPCFVTMEPATDVTAWPINVVEKPSRRLSTPKPELDGSYVTPITQKVRGSVSSVCSLESSLTWDSYPYQERVNTSLSWDNFPLNRSKNSSNVENVCN